MGMYTELFLAVELNNEEKEILKILEYMIEGKEIPKSMIPNHPLFSCERFHMIFHGESFYFHSSAHAKLNNNMGIRTDLTTIFNLKNYDSEIEKFLDWLCPYIMLEGYLGTYMYEEWEEPLFIYKKDGNIFIGDNVINMEKLK